MPPGRTYWVDRCLGTAVVPAALRKHGVDVRTYTDLYPDDPKVPDARWIVEVSALGWVIVTKDKNIRRDQEELAALRRACARYVCLAATSMRGEEQAACLVHHWKTLDGLVAHKRAPLIVTVTRGHVQWLDGERWRKVKHKR
ncbi:MAG: hypothetical protein MJD61_12565 [Proteobacteria bacterium]|nr:hypothetical protein [Pseudomonadota bacterium]